MYSLFEHPLHEGSTLFSTALLRGLTKEVIYICSLARARWRNFSPTAKSTWSIRLNVMNTRRTINNWPLCMNQMLISRQMALLGARIGLGCVPNGPDGEEQGTSPHLAVSVPSQTAICIKFPQNVLYLQAAVCRQRHTGYTGTGVHSSHTAELRVTIFTPLCSNTFTCHYMKNIDEPQKHKRCASLTKTLWHTASSSRYEKPWASVNECVCRWKWKWGGGVKRWEGCLPARPPASLSVLTFNVLL